MSVLLLLNVFVINSNIASTLECEFKYWIRNNSCGVDYLKPSDTKLYLKEVYDWKDPLKTVSEWKFQNNSFVPTDNTTKYSTKEISPLSNSSSRTQGISQVIFIIIVVVIALVIYGIVVLVQEFL